jgi:cytochrome P450
MSKSQIKFTYDLPIFHDVVSLILPNFSVGACVTFESHKVRRDALNPCFTKKYLVRLEPTLQEKTNQLLQCFEKAVTTDGPFNLSDAFFAYSNE